jgi:hypothetical protein
MEAGHNIIHGAGQEQVRPASHMEKSRSTTAANTITQSTRVSRADKTAPMPEPSKGAGLEKTPASAGDSKGKDQGGRSSTN